ncbi:alpha/beta hydrolase [Brevibacillus laterosporus]|uniref:alpha/beta hydrolase n=1 Tax=Brevibacillus laterosporus TaxID=1465 RepID=UPI000476AB3E|nr:alpha/beta hydrolase [Brevibacillus laterosporus]ATO50836.1 alpha/beta hydrolase [Brevibacillus laterosporus DSM 25]MBG9804499.1 salicylate esterase [Brevibacillus laterosporus]MED2002993.1 alpha/beta hydrolase [Brevibacillus laterosporus]MED4763973.1 alpha/beta hydrolase [Brevibacillus laterosporus]TPH17008.1 alpha/beta hydrolase [Brevibacillus laterosporus]
MYEGLRENPFSPVGDLENVPCLYPHQHFYYPYPSDFPYSSPITFVLVHGSWGDCSYWYNTAEELYKMGNTVYTPNLPGHGGDTNKSVTHDDYVRSVIDFIEERNLCNFVLVGHSFGGTVISKVAEQIPKRIRRLVFMDAFVVRNGYSVADEIPPEGKALWEELARESPDNTIMLPFQNWRETFMNTADLELASEIYQTVTPEPAGPLFQKLDLSVFYSLSIPKSYYYLTEDTALPQGEQYGWHPHMSSRLGLFRLIKSKGDHMTSFYVLPSMIAKNLVRAGRD